jgi:hypothetical protein
VIFVRRCLLYSILLPALCVRSLSARPVAGIAAPAGFSIRAAMVTLFGNFNSKSGASEYDIPQTTTYDLNGSGLKIGDEIVVRPLRVLEAWEDGTHKMILLTYSRPKDGGSFDCHACAPLIGVAVFVRNGPQWKVESSRAVVTRGGSFGIPTKVFRVVQLGPRRIGIEMTDSYMGGGETEDSMAILVAWGGKVNEALGSFTHDDNKGDCGGSDMLPCYVIRKKVSYVPGENKDYFDIAFELSGTELTDTTPCRTKMVRGTERFVFIDGFYKIKTRTGDTASLDQWISGH